MEVSLKKRVEGANKGWRGEQSVRQKKKSRGKCGRRRVNKLGDLDYRLKENCSSVSLCLTVCDSSK